MYYHPTITVFLNTLSTINRRLSSATLSTNYCFQHQIIYQSPASTVWIQHTIIRKSKSTTLSTNCCFHQPIHYQPHQPPPSSSLPTHPHPQLLLPSSPYQRYHSFAFAIKGHSSPSSHKICLQSTLRVANNQGI